MSGRIPDETEVSARVARCLEGSAPDRTSGTYRWSSTVYGSDEVYRQERTALDRVPVCLGSVQALGAEADGYVVRRVWGTAWIVRRVASGFVAHLNRCRHRGMELVSEEKGRGRTIVCPFHGWSYDEQGACRAIPGKEKGFPDLALGEIRLVERPVVERGGLLWMLPDPSADASVDAYFAPLEPHFGSWALGSYAFRKEETYAVKANWKLLTEAFLEAYHLPYLHPTSVAPGALRDASAVDYYAFHSRAVYPLKRLKQDPKSEKAPFSRYVSVLYHVFPQTFVSFQPFTAFTLSFWPTSPGTTNVRMCLLVRPEDVASHPELVQREQELLTQALEEDLKNAEVLHRSLDSNPATELLAGGYEGQIVHFHRGLRAAGVASI